MKTNTIQLTVGQLVMVDGLNGQFRYIGKNIVQNIESGKVFSVCKNKIKVTKSKKQSKILSVIARIIVGFIAAFLLTSILFDLFLNLK